ncbi:probable glutathione S-transferase [Rhododendron vialii]|uniref:probable glutathione S-transferase n=1 Tax=Rhododendron vialii TaxID=182163 RepID=UPI00265F5C04|nr:probable glutathione S-transferase [Rhododendron vialii]
MADEKITLLSTWLSPFGIRVRIALAQKGVEYVYKEENLGNKSSLLLQMNPVKKQIPVLIHNGKPVCESLVIVQYIDEVWNQESPLLPSDPYQRAQAKFWADFVDKKLYSLGMQLSSSTGEAAKKELLESFKLLEGELGQKPFFGGETLGFVDVALIPFYSWFSAFEHCGNFLMVEECPRLLAWAHKCLEKESVSKTLPDPNKAFDFLMVYLKKQKAN